MALVAIAALCMALLFVTFKAFDRRNIPLLHAIVVNYFTAFAWGVFLTVPWNVDHVSGLMPSAFLLGALFISIFYLTALGTQRIGVAATSVSSKMSLVLTVLFAVVVFGERPGTLAWFGILLAVIAVVISSAKDTSTGAPVTWWLPALLFCGTAAVDICLNTVQRTLLQPSTESLFPTLVFGIAGLLGTIVLALKKSFSPLRKARVLIGGFILGTINYASLYFIVSALARSGFDASSMFPLMNIGVILFGTALSVLLFRERLTRMQWVGIGTAVTAMALILCA